MKVSTVLFILAMSMGVRGQQQVLKYTEASCKDLVPVYGHEDLSDLGLGPEKDNNANDDDDDSSSEQNDNVVFETPKRLTTRNPPFRIQTSFNQYRSGRQYQINIVAEDFFDGFMLQVQGRREDGNVTQVGRFTAIPSVARLLRCGGNRFATVVNKERPVRLGNLTFTWQSPERNVGILRVEASIAFRDAYVAVASGRLTFKEPGISIRGCGRNASCFRSCRFAPDCQADGARYMVTMAANSEQNRISFKLGGFMPNATNYAAIGFGQDRDMKLVDFVTCSRRDNVFDTGHYFLEEPMSAPFRHKRGITLDRMEIDRDTGFAWCEFSRPINPDDPYDLDLSRSWHQFYFYGNMNQNSIPIIPNLKRVQRSSRKVNAASKVFNDIHYDPANALELGSRAEHAQLMCSLLMLPMLLILVQSK